MSHTQSKTGIDRLAELLNPTSPQNYWDRGCSLHDADALATRTQQRLQIEPPI